MKTPTGISFYLVVALLTLCDTAVFTAVIWLSMIITGSAFVLGSVLCLSVAVPFVLDWVMGGRLARLQPATLFGLRAAAFILVALLALGGAIDSFAGFILVGLVVGVADFLTVSFLEIRNTKYVVAGRIESGLASRLMQTAIQIGGFAGAVAGGLLVNGEGSRVFIGFGLAGAAASLPLLLLVPQLPAAMPAAMPAETAEGPAPTATPPGRAMLPVTGLLFGLALVSFHIGALNSMLPIVFQKVRFWTASSYGIASGCAGIGAFTVAALPPKRLNFLWFPWLLLAADAVLVFCPLLLFAAIAAFFVGAATNHLRITLRAQLMQRSGDERQAEWIGQRNAYVSLGSLAVAPLLLTLLITPPLLNPHWAPEMLVGAGLLVCAGTLAAELLAHRRAGPAWVETQTGYDATKP